MSDASWEAPWVPVCYKHVANRQPPLYWPHQAPAGEGTAHGSPTRVWAEASERGVKVVSSYKQQGFEMVTLEIKKSS